MASGAGNAAVEWHQRPPNPKNPIVFFDITIGTIPAGRIKMELFADIAPKTAENFSIISSTFPTGKQRARQTGVPPFSENIEREELQLDNEQDIYNLRKECEEKDTTIKELSTFLQSSKFISSKRIAELEDIIRRKKMIITKLKKDVMILEQKMHGNSF